MDSSAGHITCPAGTKTFQPGRTLTCQTTRNRIFTARKVFLLMNSRRILLTAITVISIAAWVYWWGNRNGPKGETYVNEDWRDSVFDSDGMAIATISPLKDSAYPLLFEAAFQNGTRIAQRGKRFRFQKKYVGDLKCPTGKLIACDPINAHVAAPFAEQFPAGNFPVELAIADHQNYPHVAFARIRFSDEPVTTWKFTHIKDENGNISNDTVPWCFSVDAALAFFIDAEANHDFVAGGDQAWNETWNKTGDVYDLHGKIISRGKYNMAFFTTGYGDGYYDTYVGYDAAGKICRLLADFGLLKWNYRKIYAQ